MNAPTLPHDLVIAINERLEGLKAVQRAGSHVHAQHLVDAWASFVDEVATYRMSIYDYTNDLDARNLLEDAAAAIRPELALQLAALLAPFDARFLSNTMPARRTFRLEETLATLPEAERETMLEDVAGVMRSMQVDSETQAAFDDYLSELRAGRAASRFWNSQIPREPGPELLAELVEFGHA